MSYTFLTLNYLIQKFCHFTPCPLNLYFLHVLASSLSISLYVSILHMKLGTAMNPFFLLSLSFCSLLVQLQYSVSYAFSQGSSLSVENPDHVLVSPNGVFSAGFYPVGNNAYCFAIWFSDPSCQKDCTVVWMANRDVPVNGRRSKLSLLTTGNLVLIDAGQERVWATDTFSRSSLSLSLYDSGNLVLITMERAILWQSFDSPTDTLLPSQPFTRETLLVSFRSRSNFSSGFYKLSFADDNVLQLLYDGPEVSSVYWPYPWLLRREAGRFTFNSSRVALLDELGKFSSSDNVSFYSADYGTRIRRRLTLDFDGNLRLYGWEEESRSWIIWWQVLAHSCRIHGACGPNMMCSYVPSFGRKCSCLPGYRIKNATDWSLGCEPEIKLSCDTSEASFLQLTQVEAYGYEFQVFENYTLEMCKEVCLKRCDCKGFIFKYKYQNHPETNPYCFPKIQLLNSFRSPNFRGDLYLKVAKTGNFSSNDVGKNSSLDCPAEAAVVLLDRNYEKNSGNWPLKFLVWFASVVGVIESVAIVAVWLSLMRTKHYRSAATQGYLPASIGFKRFTYDELKKATWNFREEIGRGGGGIVYKAILDDHRLAAIKRLNEASQGEAEFLAEVSTIGKLNHMNLIEMWGYCAEGKYRLLVYEYMKHGSLANNLSSEALDWKKRYQIAVGTARGLAYLHEECLEWVLHCDIKPENILLDSNYQPKVSDFGLSQLLSRVDDSYFSRIRGTRGYMAPEWIFNLPITSKVDVYSYGMVVLEMVTGRRPAMGSHSADSDQGQQKRRLVEWIKEKRSNGAAAAAAAVAKASWVNEIIDPAMGNDIDRKKLETLIEVALQCVEEHKDARPNMSQVVEMLLQHEYHR